MQSRLGHRLDLHLDLFYLELIFATELLVLILSNRYTANEITWLEFVFLLVLLEAISKG